MPLITSLINEGIKFGKPVKYEAGRILNAVSISCSYIASSVLHKPIIYGMPPAVGIELTNHCNLRCPECPSGNGTMKRAKGFMDPIFFREFMKELTPSLLSASLYFQGEPMLHPEFSSFLYETSTIYNIVSTNGHFLTAENCDLVAGSGLRRIIISLDGLDQATYSIYRVNGNLEKVFGGIRTLTEAKRKFRSRLIIEIQMLVSRYNENQIPQARELARKIGVKLVLKSMQIQAKESVAYWLPEDSRYARYVREQGGCEIRSSFPKRCARLWFNPVITWDGRVIPCCFDKDAEYVMGDLRKSSFHEIWLGEKFMNFRKRVLRQRDEIEMCRNCTSGLYS